MMVSELFEGYDVRGLKETGVTGIETDSRKVKTGSCYVALRGRVVDGHDYVPQALERGASCLVVERAQGSGLPEVLVPSTRKSLGRIAARFWGEPSKALPVVAVTGTNGKTTVTRMLAGALAARGKVGQVGTIGASLDGLSFETGGLTTPEAHHLQGVFHRCREEGAVACVIEASSIGLAESRLAGTELSFAAFTNFTRDHLDYHGTMEAYLDAKLSLFRSLGRDAVAIVNSDDPASGRVLEAADCHYITYGAGEAHFRVETGGASLEGFTLKLTTPVGNWEGRLPLIGLYNGHNAACAAVAATGLGVGLEAAMDAIAAMPPVSGRMESVGAGRTIFVDYSHTPDSLELALKALRPLTTGRLIALFGAGGDRDDSKRPLMGRAASRNADLLFVTSDNPRTEEPQAIIDGIVQGVEGGCTCITDRREAIFRAVSEMAEGDVLLIAGKGHETYQETDGERRPFDDRVVAKEAEEAVS